MSEFENNESKIQEKHINAQPLTEREKELCKLVDDKKEELIELLKDLIKIDSRTYDSHTYSDQHEIFNFTKDFMEKNGFESQEILVNHMSWLGKDEKDKTWPNLICKFDSDKTSESPKTLQFMGHLDIVPFIEEKWDDGLGPLTPVVKDGKLYGRGAADMKGGVAAQMFACKLFKEAGIDFQGRLQMWFVPDEEIDARYGAGYMSKNHKNLVNADATIISEPTGQDPIESPAIVLGEKGHQWLRWKIYGSSGHGSVPKPKSNAIMKTVKFIALSKKKLKLPKVKPPIGLKGLAKAILSRYTIGSLLKILKSDDGEEKDPYNEDGLGIGAFFHTTVSFTQIHAGTKVNVIPDICEFETDFRILPGITTQDLFNSLANYCTKLGWRIKLPDGFSNPQDKNKKIQKRPIDVELNIISLTEGTFVSPDQEFTQLLSDVFEDVYNVSAVYFFAPGSTDAVHMRGEGIENVVIFGPSGSNTHDSNEFVRIKHLIETCKVYLLTAYRFLQKNN
jgi:succinyl-diaminopimelate desuccinylase